MEATMTDLTKTKYQWLVTDNSTNLHFVDNVEEWDDKFFDTYGTQFDSFRPWRSACGLNTIFSPPGILTRIWAKRCDTCCYLIGVTGGVGCPVNDDTCKVVKTRYE